MVHVTNGADVYMRLRPLEFRLRHGWFLSSGSLTKLVAGLLGERGRDVLGDFLVVVEFHAVAGTALRERAKVGRIAKSFGQRDHRVDDLGFTHRFGAHDDPATGVNVPDNRPEVIFG